MYFVDLYRDWIRYKLVDFDQDWIRATLVESVGYMYLVDLTTTESVETLWILTTTGYMAH